MTAYIHGATLNKPSVVQKTADEVRRELENLNRLRAAIIAETQAKTQELARIRAARKRLEPVATYKPSPEALAYREQHGRTIAAQPAPKYGGRDGLRMAAAEAATLEARLRAKEGPNARLGR